MSRSTHSDKKPIVWAFLVVSDPGQADTLEGQAAWAKEAARVRGWSLVRTVSGVSSGKLGARKLALGMLEDLTAMPPEQRPARLLMIRLERLGRGNGLEAIEVFLRLRRLGVVVHTRLDGDVSYDRASELLMPVLRFFIGGMENEVRRDKLNATYARKRKARESDPSVAVSNRVPYGLCIRDGHLCAQSPEDGAVRLAYELKVQGYGTHTIGRKLANVAPPRISPNGDVQPQIWNADRVRKLIINVSYKGTIVDEDIWIRAQRPAREVNRPARRYEYALGGALRCECGRALVGVKGSGKPSSPFLYYQCKNYERHGRLKHYRSDVLEQQFLAILGRLTVDDALLERYVGSQSVEQAEAAEGQLAAIEAELRTMDARRRLIHRAFEDGVLAQRDLQWRLDDLHQEQSNLERRRDALNGELKTLQALRTSRRDIKKLVKDAGAHWIEAQTEDRRALAKAIGRAFGGLIVGGHSQLRLGVESPRNDGAGVAAAVGTNGSPGAAAPDFDPGDALRFDNEETNCTGLDSDPLIADLRASLAAFLRCRSRNGRIVGNVRLDSDIPIGRADIISVGSDMHVYVIVAVSDTLARVSKCLRLYSAALDRTTIVIAASDLGCLDSIEVPDGCGVLVFCQKRTQLHFRYYRVATQNKTPRPLLLLRLLPAEDLRSLLSAERIPYQTHENEDALRTRAVSTIAFGRIHAWSIRTAKRIAANSASTKGDVSRCWLASGHSPSSDTEIE
jgi:Resolvase, N terminal domain/Recombinase zinc beta ribbon domain